MAKSSASSNAKLKIKRRRFEEEEKELVNGKRRRTMKDEYETFGNRRVKRQTFFETYATMPYHVRIKNVYLLNPLSKKK